MHARAAVSSVNQKAGSESSLVDTEADFVLRAFALKRCRVIRRSTVIPLSYQIFSRIDLHYGAFRIGLHGRVCKICLRRRTVRKDGQRLDLQRVYETQTNKSLPPGHDDVRLFFPFSTVHSEFSLHFKSRSRDLARDSDQW